LLRDTAFVDNVAPDPIDKNSGMSVYTSVTQRDLDHLEQFYPLGKVLDLQGIEAGVQNTNYFLSAEQGEFVLTLFETIKRDEVARTMRFMHFLAMHDIPSSDPLASRDGHYVESLRDKPVAIVKRVSGLSINDPNEIQLQSLATALAKWHNAVQSFEGRWNSRFDANWRQQTAHDLIKHLDAGQRSLLQRQLQECQTLALDELPHGMIHSDLFRDNSLFIGNNLSAIIDLYDIYYGPYIYDIAVIINDWCRDQQGLPQLSRARHFINAYQQQRPLNTLEIKCMPALLRLAALRFWLSRLHALHYPNSGELALRKDPEEFQRLLHFWQTVEENPASRKN